MKRKSCKEKNRLSNLLVARRSLVTMWRMWSQNGMDSVGEISWQHLATKKYSCFWTPFSIIS
jgi:hypothetical protein